MKAWRNGATSRPRRKPSGSSCFVVEIRADRDLEPAFASMVERKAGALLIGAGPFLTGRQRQLAALALRHQLPAARSCASSSRPAA